MENINRKEKNSVAKDLLWRTIAITYKFLAFIVFSEHWENLYYDECFC